MTIVLAFERTGGRIGARNHLLVLPSVVCATRVARDIADAVGGVAITHQHGCSQIGDDEVQTATAFEQIACNPNVGAVLVVSLGCETVQGREVASVIASRRDSVEFVGIQDSGGSDAAVGEGQAIARRLAAGLALQVRTEVDPGKLVVGIDASRRNDAAASLARHALAAGASLVWGAVETLPEDLAAEFRPLPAFGPADPVDGARVALVGAGSRAEQHTALVAAGAQVIATFPDNDEGPLGFPLCPVVSVATASSLHAVLADEFDAGETTASAALWQLILEVVSGAPSAAEALGHETFALSRLARTM